MTITDQLLEYIIADPEDNTARLAYADALEETGQSDRAEFVRVQMELAELQEEAARSPPISIPRCELVKREPDLRRREMSLIGKNSCRWFPLPEGWITTLGRIVPNPHRGTALVRRGFIEVVHCRMVDWIGTDCPECHVSRALMVDPDPCAHCHGTRRINAHGPAIVRAAPIRRVEITDKELIHEENGLLVASLGPAALAWARKP
jgi:uncharacterized protein (TIGR02996 family)